MFNQDYWRILFSCIHRAVNSPRSKNKCLSNHCWSSVDLRFLVHSTLIWSGKFHSLGEYDWWPSAKFLFFWFSNLKHKKWNFFTLFMNKSAQDIFVFRCTIWDLNFVLIAVSIQIDRRDIFRLQWLPYKSCQSKKKEIITPPYIYMGSTETSKASVLSHSILVESYLLFFLSDHKMVTKPSFGLSVWIIIQVRIILFQKTFHIFLIFISNKWTWTKSTNIVFF